MILVLLLIVFVVVSIWLGIGEVNIFFGYVVLSILCLTKLLCSGLWFDLLLDMSAIFFCMGAFVRMTICVSAS